MNPSRNTYFSQSVDLTPTRKFFEYSFVPERTDPSARIGFSLGGNDTDVTIDKVSLLEGPLIQARAASHEMVRRMGGGNNLMAAKLILGHAAKEDFELLRANGYSYCRIGYKMDKRCGKAPDDLLPDKDVRYLREAIDQCPASPWTPSTSPADPPYIRCRLEKGLSAVFWCGSPLDNPLLRKEFPCMMRTVGITGLCLFITTAALSKAPDSVRVFILAGQSNMEGQGVVDLDHPKYYNGGRGILINVMKNPRMAPRYAHLRDKAGKWVVRDDVSVRFRNRQGVMAGGLTIGFTGYGSLQSRHHIGPELQIGHQLGDALDAPVLLIKTAWGGKSLHKDFRPPSSGGETGPFYTKMLAEVQEAFDNVETEFPQLKGRKLEISGFIWFQGWNDMFNETARTEYEQNLVHLIQDVRMAWGRPKLPVVVGELGNGGDNAGANMKAIRQAQAAACKRKELGGNAVFVKTTRFHRPKEDSPNVGHGHHWFGNAESYFLIGEALGKAMVELVR